MLTLLGWFVVHSLWQGTFIAGVAALVMSLVPRHRADIRGRVALVSFAIMTTLPLATALLGPDVMLPSLRRPVLMAIDAAIPMPAYLERRSLVVSMLGSLWMAGFVLCVTRLFAAWRRAQVWRRAGTAAVHGDIAREVDTLRDALALPYDVDVRRSTLAPVPMVLGARAPTILLPGHAVDRLARAQLRSILAHELAHVRRKDYIVNLAQLAVECTSFFHPGARWISRRVRIEREHDCDDAAIAVTGDRSALAHALATLDETRGDCRVAVAALSGTLVERIERIAGRANDRREAGRAVGLMVATTLGAALIVAAALALPQRIPPGARLRTRTPAPAIGTNDPPTSPTPERPRRPAR
jgi:beta-lactamase regulating signal transducer with metallopeptidase domain